MKISIIIPIYNNESTLEYCVNSFLKQNYEKLELILIDDGSKDKSKLICRKLERKYREIVFLDFNNNGVSTARNKGLAVATGDIIGFCDADDYSEEGTLWYINSIFLNHKVDIVVGGYNNIINEKIIKYNLKYHEIISSDKLTELVLVNHNVMGAVWNKFFLKECLKGRSFDENLSYCEDTYFLIELLSTKPQLHIYMSSRIIYNYVTNKSGVTNLVNNYFDKNGNLKYIISHEKMLESLSIRKKVIGLVHYKMFILAIDVAIGNHLTKEQNIYLSKVMNENRKYFILFFGKNYLLNCKRMCKIILKKFHRY